MAIAPTSKLTRSGAGPTDASLVVAARAGEGWAIEALFRRYTPVAIGLAHRLLPRDSEVDDIVQDSFVFALTHLGALRNPQAFAAWLSSIVVRTTSKRLRRQRLLTRLGIRRAEPIDPDVVVSPTASAEIAFELRAIYGVLEALPSEQRIALVLRRVEGLEVVQIAEYMNLSLSTVKRRLGAAEASLERSQR